MSIGIIVKKRVERTRILLQTIQLRSFDISTPDGRSQERYRRVALTALTSILSQGVKIVTVLITVPLALGYLGNERYSVWLIISSLLAFLTFADLGIGNGLLNLISEANGQDDRDLALKAVSSAFVILSGIAVLLALVFILIYPFVNWSKVFNLSSTLAKYEINSVVIIVLACFLINIPLGVVQKIQAGYQEGYYNNLWQIVASVLSLIGVLVCVQLSLGLSAMVLVFAGTPVVATLCNGLHLWGLRYRYLRPRINQISLPIGWKIANFGLMFLLIQLAAAMAFSIDNLIVAHMLSAEAVADYGIPQHLFVLLSLLISLILTPLWPAYGEAMARHDMAWIKTTLMRTIKLSLLVVTPLALLFVLFGVRIIYIWVGSSVQPTFMLLLGFGLWAIISAVGNALAMFLNGVGVLRFQAAIAVLMALVNLPLSIWLTHNFGLPGPIWGTVVSYTFFALLPILIYVKRFFIKKEKNYEVLP